MRYGLICLLLLCCRQLPAQSLLQEKHIAVPQMEVTGSRKAVRTSGDILVLITPAACLASTVLMKDWEGLAQGALSGATTIGLAYVLKYITGKKRPDGSDNLSFPSLHTAISFAGAAFLQRRYGWRYGIPAYVLSGYVGWSRVYGKKHDWWDVAAGAIIGAGSSYAFTRPLRSKAYLTVAPVASPSSMGIAALIRF